MKRTSAAILMLAGLGGCATPDKVGTPAATGPAAAGPRPFNKGYTAMSKPDVKGVRGEPVAVKQASATSTAPGGVVTADAPGTIDNMVRPAAGFGSVRVNGGYAGCADGSCGTGGGYGGNGLPAMGPMGSGLTNMLGHGGILPVPAMGVPGAVAAVGAYGPGSEMYAGMYAGGRTSIRFANPAGMKVTWQAADGNFPDSGLEAPARYNFPQTQTYRLRLTGIPNRPGRVYYPTLEVYGATPKTITYLSHNTVPVAFSDEDFEQVNAGNLVVKVIYLPDEKHQDIASVAGAEELISTRLLPGVNPVEEANARGTILAVVRIGNIDLQDPNTPAVDAPVPGMMGLPPGAMPSGPAMPSMRPMPATPPAAMPVMPVTPPASPRLPATLPSSVKPLAPTLGTKPISLPN
jgi:hypothetical protein